MGLNIFFKGNDDFEVPQFKMMLPFIEARTSNGRWAALGDIVYFFFAMASPRLFLKIGGLRFAVCGSFKEALSMKQ